MEQKKNTGGHHGSQPNQNSGSGSQNREPNRTTTPNTGSSGQREHQKQHTGGHEQTRKGNMNNTVDENFSNTNENIHSDRKSQKDKDMEE